jgi:hypothetical protein
MSFGLKEEIIFSASERAKATSEHNTKRKPHPTKRNFRQQHFLIPTSVTCKSQNFVTRSAEIGDIEDIFK